MSILHSHFQGEKQKAKNCLILVMRPEARGRIPRSTDIIA